MQKQAPKTRVIFRKFKDTGDVIALFPATAATQRIDECESYQSVGQHGAASVNLIEDTFPATSKEYEALYEELVRIGYDLEIVRRFTPADRREREKQIRGHP